MMRLLSPALAVAFLTVLAGMAADRVEDAVRTPPAAMSFSSAACAAPAGLTAIWPPLSRVETRIKQGEPLTIVALGSSSTRGVGASAPELSYPSRLQAELRQRLPDIQVRVLNRGRSGEEVPQMVARMERDVLGEHPDLVVWQFGTNAVLHHDDVAAERDPVARGIARLQQSGSDVVLMDLQYAPRVLARPDYAAMEQLIAEAAHNANVALFHRFAIMQAWQRRPERPGVGLKAAPFSMIARDGLHMNDLGYGCLAANLAGALTGNWPPRLRVARGGDARTPAVAGLRLPADWPPAALDPMP